jgi:hypothetical protein
MYRLSDIYDFGVYEALEMHRRTPSSIHGESDCAKLLKIQYLIAVSRNSSILTAKLIKRFQKWKGVHSRSQRVN